MKSLVSKVVAKGQVDTHRASTLAQLLQPRTNRSFSREVEDWMLAHDLVNMLETLAAHLLRTLPTDMFEETDHWVDAQKVTTGSLSTISKSEAVTGARTVYEDKQTLIEAALWQRVPVTVTTAKKNPALKGVPARTQHHRIASITAIAPLLPSIHHDNVVPVYGHSMDGKQVSIIQKRMPCTLRERLTSMATEASLLKSTTVLRVASDVLQGLSHLHTLGFLHRDLSCDAVLARGADDGDGYAVAGFDFMVRTARGRMTSQVWAPRLAAPETLQNRNFEVASDIYVFATMLLEVMQYGRPFDSPADIPTTCPPNVPTPLWDLLKKCLSRSPFDRPPVHELLKRIQLLESQPAMHIPLPQLAMGASEVTATAPGGASQEAAPVRVDQKLSADLLSQIINAGGPPDAASRADVTVTGPLAAASGSWDVVQRAIALNPVMEQLALVKCDLSVAGPLQLHASVQLSVLKIEDAGLTATNLPSVLHDGVLLPTLRELSVTGNKLGNSGCLELVRRARSRAPNLEELGLASTGMSMTIFESFAGMMLETAAVSTAGEAVSGHWTALRTVHLGGAGNDVGYHGVSHLCRWLMRDATLTHLDLSGAKIDYYSVAAIGQLLRSNKSLTRINLEGCHLSPPGIRMLAAAVKSQSAQMGRIAPRVAVMIDPNDDCVHTAELRAACKEAEDEVAEVSTASDMVSDLSASVAV